MGIFPLQRPAFVVHYRRQFILLFSIKLKSAQLVQTGHCRPSFHPILPFTCSFRPDTKRQRQGYLSRLCRKLVTVVSQTLTSKPMSLSRGPPSRPTQDGVSPARVGSIGGSTQKLWAPAVEDLLPAPPYAGLHWQLGRWALGAGHWICRAHAEDW